MSDYYDTLETREPAMREAALMEALPRHVAQAQIRSAAMAEILADVNAQEVDSRDALVRLPVTRKSELLARQMAVRAAGGDPFGGFAAARPGPRMPRLYASPGPIYEPEGTARDYWRTGRAMSAAGFRAGDLVHNAFSYHMTPGAFMMESGAHALGCTVFPAGTGQTEQQLDAMVDLKPRAYLGTPGFLRILLEKAFERSLNISSMNCGLVSGEAFPNSLRDWFAARGMNVFQCYATADVGLIAYETSSRQGLVVDENVIVEIVRPGTGMPLPDGEVGEVVVTVLNSDYPLVRFGTGDLSAVLPGTCATGRTNLRLKGWLGRADQTTKVRGMFVHPGQVAEIARRFPEIGRTRLVVSGEMANDELALQIECAAEPGEDLLQKIAEAIRDVTKLRGAVRVAPPGSLPNDGKVIDDVRSYQ